MGVLKVWDKATQQYVPVVGQEPTSDLYLDDLQDVNLFGQADDDYLKRENGEWVPRALESATQVLGWYEVYNNTDWAWGAGGADMPIEGSNNRGNGFITQSGNALVANVTGIYFLAGQAALNNYANSGYATFNLNGQLSYVYIDNPPEYDHPHFSVGGFPMYMTAGQWFTFYIYSASAATLRGSSLTRWLMAYLGPM